MAKVFIVNRPVTKNSSSFTYDVSPAQEFGEVVFLFDSTQRPEPSENPSAARQHILSTLENFDPDDDFIVWAGGDPLGMLLVSAHLGAWHNSVKYLKWEKERDLSGRVVGGHYIPLTVKI